MKPELRYLLVSLEQIYSPGAIEDDAAILSAVGTGLVDAGHEVMCVRGERLTQLPVANCFDTVLAMCRGGDALRALKRLSRQHVHVMNTPESVERCCRANALRVLRAEGLPAPDSWIRSTDVLAAPPCPRPEGGVWLKRGDLHSLDSQDVVLVNEASGFAPALAALRDRGLESIVVQTHVEGSTIKCYSVKPGPFLSCHPPVSARGHRRLIEQAMARIARAFELNIFGVDIVITPTGDIAIVDVNPWPSFAPCLEQAAEAIVTCVDRVSAQARVDASRVGLAVARTSA